MMVVNKTVKVKKDKCILKKKQPVATEQLKVVGYVMQIVDQWIVFSKTRLHFKRNISSKNWYAEAEDRIYFQYSSVDKKRCRHDQ